MFLGTSAAPAKEYWHEGQWAACFRRKISEPQAMVVPTQKKTQPPRIQN